MDALGAYGSESESEGEENAPRDRDARDDDGDDAFVGPARPPPRVMDRPVDGGDGGDDGDDAFVGPARPPPRVMDRPVDERDGGDDGDDAFVGPARPPPRVMDRPVDGGDGGDIAFLEAMCGDAEDTSAGTSTSRRALEPNAPTRLLVALPAAGEETEETRAAQARVNDIFLSARRAGKTPSELMFTSSSFRNPEFMENCARDGVVAECAFASGARVAVDDEPLDASDFYRALAEEQKRVTEKHLAERNGIAFQSSRPSTVSDEDARKAAVNSAIAKARVEARIALQRAGK